MDVVIYEAGQTQLAKHAKRWAVEQFVKAKAGRDAVEMALNPTPVAYLKTIFSAGQKAGKGGTVLFLVGHGGDITTAHKFGMKVDLAPGEDPRKVGIVDLAPSKKLRMETDDVFYDHDPDGAGPAMSQAKHDKSIFDGAPDPKNKAAYLKWMREGATKGAIDRAEQWNRYLYTGMYLKHNGVRRVVLLTCKVGSATVFLDKIARDWQIEVQAFNRRIVSQEEEKSTNVRLFLEGDADGVGSNTVDARTEIPKNGYYIAKPKK